MNTTPTDSAPDPTPVGVLFDLGEPLPKPAAEPTHEILDTTLTQVIAESELAIHQFPEVKGRPNDLPLPGLAARENRCSRTLFYLGREHSFQSVRLTSCILDERVGRRVLFSKFPHFSLTHGTLFALDSPQLLCPAGRRTPWRSHAALTSVTRTSTA